VTRYIVYHEVFEDGEWQVVHDTIEADDYDVHSAGDSGIVAFKGDGEALVVNAENFITARTEGVE